MHKVINIEESKHVSINLKESFNDYMKQKLASEDE